jgi:hypothetical protein
MNTDADAYASCPDCDTELAGGSCDRCVAEAWAAAPAQRAERMRAALHRLIDRASALKIAHLFTALVRSERQPERYEPNFGTAARDMQQRSNRERRARSTAR